MLLRTIAFHNKNLISGLVLLEIDQPKLGLVGVSYLILKLFKVPLLKAAEA